MSDLLQAAASDLFASLQEHASQALTYRRGGISLDLRGSLGRTETAEVSQGGMGVQGEWADVLLDAADLAFEGQQLEPEPGDQIVWQNAGRTYTRTVVALPGTTTCWRWSDSYHLRRRIHTVLTHEA